MAERPKLSIGTIKTLRAIWRSEVIPYLQHDLDQVNQAWPQVKDNDTLRVLQGRALAIGSLIHLPEHLEAALVMEEQNKENERRALDGSFNSEGP